MTYRPKSLSKKEAVFSICTALLAVILFLLSGVVNKFSGIYQITALVLAVVSIQFYIKYVVSNYVYEAAEDAFKIYKITGKKSICVSCLDYDMSLSLCIDSDVYTADKNKYPKYSFNVNFTKNFMPKKYYVYFFEFNDKVCMMKFEPDEIFANALNEKISFALNNAKNS